MDYKDKIRKLLALAKSPEPEEAKLALLKARKLMAEHKLRKQHRDYYTPQEIAKICDSYGYGFARGVYEAFTRQNEENQEYGLVLKVPKEVKDELEKIGPPKEFKKTPQPKTVGELDAAWRGIEDGRKFNPSNKLEEKKQET